MKSFSSFLGGKDRENKEHLHILRVILEKAGFRVGDHLDDRREPYLYVRRPQDVMPELEGLSFGGVRIYTRGHDIICYRAQNKEHTEPFGNTYQLDIKGMFSDLVREHSQEKVGYKIIRYVINDLKDFFVRSLEADREDDTGDEDSQFGAVVVGGSGTDYANQVTSNDVNRRP